MAKKRKTFTDKFKAKVALEGARGLRSANEVALEHQTYPNQVSQWKRTYVRTLSNYSVLEKVVICYAQKS